MKLMIWTMTTYQISKISPQMGQTQIKIPTNGDPLVIYHLFVTLP